MTDFAKLGINEISPIDMNDPAVRSSLEITSDSVSNPNLHNILKVRTAIQQFLCTELIKQEYVHPPIYMMAGCTDPLNHQTFPARINYYGEEISLTQSLILQKMLMVMLSPCDKVFWASPNIRMEIGVSKKNYKYVSEFMQVDLEKRCGTYAEMLETISSLMRNLYSHLNETVGDIVTSLRGRPLPIIDNPLEVIDAQDCKMQNNLTSDDEVERWGAEHSKGLPFFVVNLKREAYDCYDSTLGRFLNYDVIVPPIGHNPNPIECLSGAERTRSIADLKQRMDDLGYPREYFAPFFALFESLDKNEGKITSAGAGFGIERLTFAILGLSDVHQVYPFPRHAESKIAI